MERKKFSRAFVERVNSKQVNGIIAEPVRIDKVMQGRNDRICRDL